MTILLFRSEDDVDRWCERRSFEKGGVMSVEQCWLVAREWYGGRQLLDWRPKPAGEAERIFKAAGLEGPHWQFG